MTAADRAADALRRHLPHHAAPLIPLGAGLDNMAFRSGDLVVRVATDHDVAAEAGLLRALAPCLPIAIPTPVFADAGLGVLAYPFLPGTPLLNQPPPATLAATLGRTLRALHHIPSNAIAHLMPVERADPAAWLDDLTGPPHLLAILQSEIPDASPLAVPCHADLGAEHLLADAAGLTAIIDWTDAACTDPALDFARILRDFGPAVLAATLVVYGPLPDDAAAFRARVLFFARAAALEDLAYARATGHTAYAAAATRALTWLFPE